MKGFSHILILVLIGVAVAVTLFHSNRPQIQAKQIVSPQVETQAKQATPSAETTQRLEKYLTVEAALLGISDNVSLYFKDLKSNNEVSIDPTKSWIPASTIKAYVVLEAFRQRSLGLIDFDKTVTIKAENVVPTELETDEFPRLREGTQATIKQLVEAMIIQSDNTAYNTLLDILDRRNINLSLKNIGITETVVGEKLNLDDGQFQTDLQVLGRQPNTTTVKDLATFFDLLYNKKIANADEILTIFKRQKINDMIPALLPNDIAVAHKTGDWAPIYHDGGVVYKPDNPFILTIFTNSDDPRIVARMAEVAYFQTAASVGKLTAFNTTPSFQALQSNSHVYLSEAPNGQVVLAAETPDKFPEISASDLGITQKDLNVTSMQAKDFLGAIITPGSFLYNVKKFFEDAQLKNAQGNSSKVQALVNLSKNRLSEAKSLISTGDFKTADIVLKESENNLEQATQFAKDDSNKDLLLLQIKRANDLHYSVLAERAATVNDAGKEQFIDDVYNFYQQNHQKVAPIINTSVAANPIQQKPAVGTITEIKDNQAKIQFDDGTSKEIVLAPDTKVRSFQESSYQSVSNIQTGDKVAVVGLTNSNSQIIPQFILKNIPKELPQVHQGTVIEIKPDENTMKILDKKGQEEIIKINLDTVIKGKDTNVSLEGIKAGSQVTIFGTTQNNLFQTSTPVPSVSSSEQPSFSSGSPIPFQPSLSNSSPNNPVSGSVNSTNQKSPTSPQSPSNNSPQSQGQSNGSNTGNTGKNITVPANTKVTTPTNSQTTNTPAQTKPTIGVQATSITVTKNSSGKDEKVSKSEPKKEEPKKEEPKKSPETKK